MTAKRPKAVLHLDMLANMTIGAHDRVTNDGRPSVGATPWWRRTFTATRVLLPRGGALSEQSWSTRHRGICVLLWAHVVALPFLGVLRHETAAHSLFEAAIVAVFAVGALLRRLSREVRSASATIGLLASSAILVHFFDGLIELHFHFFVTVAVVALYQAWGPLLLALGFVVFHHTVIGTLAPELVYNHPSAVHNPGLFALVHGGFVLAESIACLVVWRFSEDALDSERAARGGLEKAHRDLAQAQDLSGMGSWDWDVTANTVTWSDQMYALAGVDPTTFTPSVESFLGLVHADDRVRVAELVSAAYETQTGLDYEYRPVQPDGAIFHALGEWVTATEGTAARMFGTIHDVTERKRLLAEIEHLAFHDPLTGLANRRLFMDRLDHALDITRRSGHGCAVLFMDLDGFKKVNDTLGHGAGDELLCEVARRLTRAARSADTIARFGGDEFALLCEDVDLEIAIRVAERIGEELHRPVELQGVDVSPRGSIGIALAEGNLSAEDILRDADAAMYAVKTEGKGGVKVFPLAASVMTDRTPGA